MLQVVHLFLVLYALAGHSFFDGLVGRGCSHVVLHDVGGVGGWRVCLVLRIMRLFLLDELSAGLFVHQLIYIYYKL